MVLVSNDAKEGKQPMWRTGGSLGGDLVASRAGVGGTSKPTQIAWEGCEMQTTSLGSVETEQAVECALEMGLVSWWIECQRRRVQETLSTRRLVVVRTGTVVCLLVEQRAGGNRHAPRLWG